MSRCALSTNMTGNCSSPTPTDPDDPHNPGTPTRQPTRRVRLPADPFLQSSPVPPGIKKNPPVTGKSEFGRVLTRSRQALSHERQQRHQQPPPSNHPHPRRRYTNRASSTRMAFNTSRSRHETHRPFFEPAPPHSPTQLTTWDDMRSAPPPTLQIRKDSTDAPQHSDNVIVQFSAWQHLG
jgi:hypothetical protein